MVDKGKDVMNNLTLDSFDPSYFHSPAMQKFYSILQSIALGEPDTEWREEEDDDLVPDEEGLEKAGEAIRSFARTCGVEGNEMEMVTTSKKRKADGNAGGDLAKKRQKAGEEEMKESGVDYKDLFDSGKISSLKVPELKTFLRANGLKTSGKKADLVGRVEEFYQK